jgi:hypothetical protein
MTINEFQNRPAPTSAIHRGGILALLAILLASLAVPAFARDERLTGKPGAKKEMNCNIVERKKNPNKSTTCTYKCPDGQPEFVNVDEGFSCPAVANVLRK